MAGSTTWCPFIPLTHQCRLLTEAREKTARLAGEVPTQQTTSRKHSRWVGRGRGQPGQPWFNNPAPERLGDLTPLTLVGKVGHHSGSLLLRWLP